MTACNGHLLIRMKSVIPCCDLINTAIYGQTIIGMQCIILSIYHKIAVIYHKGFHCFQSLCAHNIAFLILIGNLIAAASSCGNHKVAPVNLHEITRADTVPLGIDHKTASSNIDISLLSIGIMFSMDPVLAGVQRNPALCNADTVLTRKPVACGLHCKIPARNLQVILGYNSMTFYSPYFQAARPVYGQITFCKYGSVYVISVQIRIIASAFQFINRPLRYCEKHLIRRFHIESRIGAVEYFHSPKYQLYLGGIRRIHQKHAFLPRALQQIDPLLGYSHMPLCYPNRFGITRYRFPLKDNAHARILFIISTHIPIRKHINIGHHLNPRCVYRDHSRLLPRSLLFLPQAQQCIRLIRYPIRRFAAACQKP